MEERDDRFASSSPLSCFSPRQSFAAKQLRRWAKVEDDLIGRVGLGVDGGRGGQGVVDCSLRLGLPGTAAGGGLPADASDVRPMQVQVKTQGSYHLVYDCEVCTMCSATSTPLWRRGPFGPKSLCNACGIRYKKEEEKRLALSLGPSPSPCLSQAPKARRQEQHNNNKKKYGVVYKAS